MRRPLLDRLLPPGLAALAFLLALIQRPGEASSDTKIGLHVDPIGFLGDVASAWSATEDLGHVQGGQYGGYLFPMGPFFALGRLIGLSPWLVQRLWLGLVLALAAWGTVRLLDALLERPRGTAHVVAGLLILLNPYVAVFSARTSVTLLGYAALPWLLLCVVRGAAGAALVVVAGGVRAGGRVRGRRRQRRGDGVGAARAAAARALRARDARGRRAGAVELRLADAGRDRAGVPSGG